MPTPLHKPYCLSLHGSKVVYNLIQRTEHTHEQTTQQRQAINRHQKCLKGRTRGNTPVSRGYWQRLLGIHVLRKGPVGTCNNTKPDGLGCTPGVYLEKEGRPETRDSCSYTFPSFLPPACCSLWASRLELHTAGACSITTIGKDENGN